MRQWYDIPNEANSTVAEQFAYRYGLLYSVYSFPNTVLPFFGGYFCDRLGLRLMTMVFAGLITLGQSIFAVGMTLKDAETGWYVMFVGRTVFGFGGESLSVATSAVIAQWFSGKELAFAMGVNVALARLGSVANDSASEAIAEKLPIYWALWAGLGVCILSLIATVWAFYLDRGALRSLLRNRKALRRAGLLPAPKHATLAVVAGGAAGATDVDVGALSEQLEGMERHMSMTAVSAAPATTAGAAPGFAESPALEPQHVPRATKERRLRMLGGSAARHVADALTSQEEDRAAAHEALAAVEASADADEAEEDVDALAKEEIKLTAALKFPLTFWLLSLSCVTVYCTVLPFNNIASNFIEQKWLSREYPQPLTTDEQNEMDTKANNLMAITYTVAGFITPVLGFAIDRVGLRAALNVVAAALIVLVHVLLGHTYVFPTGPLVVLGLCYSIYASALWPSVALVIEPDLQGTAYGIVTAVQNLGLALSPVAIAALQPPTNCDGSYTCVENFFIGLGVAGTICGIALNIADCRAPVAVLNLTHDKAEAKRRALSKAARRRGGAGGRDDDDEDGEDGEEDALVRLPSEASPLLLPGAAAGSSTGANGALAQSLLTTPDAASSVTHRAPIV
jgi:MFS family permease